MALAATRWDDRRASTRASVSFRNPLPTWINVFIIHIQYTATPHDFTGEFKGFAYFWELCKPLSWLSLSLMVVLKPILKRSCLKWGPFEVALAAAAGARYPLQETVGRIVGKLASGSCSVCLDMPPTRFGSSLHFSFQSPVARWQAITLDMTKNI